MNYRVEIERIDDKIGDKNGGWVKAGYVELIDGEIIGKPNRTLKDAELIDYITHTTILGKLGKHFDQRVDPEGWIKNLEYHYSRGRISATSAKEI